MRMHDPRLARMTGIPVFLYLFDLLSFDGHDLTGLPLRDRKSAPAPGAHLRRARSATPPTATSAASEFFREACAKGWEGLIAKRADEPYVHGRSRDWLKLKCAFEQELVIGGFTAAAGLAPALRRAPGRLLRGRRAALRRQSRDRVQRAHPGRARRPAGGAGDPALALRPRSGLPRAARWVKPDLVGQFAFGEWTRDGKLRHPRYLGLRDDKPAAEVVREEPAA